MAAVIIDNINEKLFDELSEESKAEAVRKADEYISKYADRKLH